MKTKLLAMLLVAMVIFSLPACGIVQAAEKKTFAIVYPIIHPFFQSCTDSAVAYAEKMGYECLIRGPVQFNVQEQIQIVEDLISMKVDGFGIGSTDAEALAPLVDRAMDQGIKVVCFDTDTPNSKRLSYIGTNNFNAGLAMGETLAKLLNNKGKVICSQGIPTQSNLMERLDGVRETLKKYPDVQIVDVQAGDGDPSKTMGNIENMVEANPDFGALIGMDSMAGPNAVIVWKTKNLSQVVITFDDLEDILQGIKDGQITASIGQRQYTWGELILKNLNDACEGKTLEEIIDTGTVEITKANVDSYKN